MVCLFEKYFITNIAEFFQRFYLKWNYIGSCFYANYWLLQSLWGGVRHLLPIPTVLAIIADTCPTSMWHILIPDSIQRPYILAILTYFGCKVVYYFLNWNINSKLMLFNFRICVRDLKLAFMVSVVVPGRDTLRQKNHLGCKQW